MDFRWQITLLAHNIATVIAKNLILKVYFATINHNGWEATSLKPIYLYSCILKLLTP